MSRLPALILLLATIAFAVAPAVTPPFSGYRPEQFPVPIDRQAIQPAGYAFAIWGLIYLWLILHAGFGLWRRAADPAWARIRLPLTIAVLVGVVWLAIALAAPVWATAAIWVMAGAALAAFLTAPTEPDRWILSAPLAIFAGWLTAAAAVSTGAVIAGYGVLSNTGAALAMLAAVLVLAAIVQTRKPRMPVYGLTVVWALVGVVVVNWGLTPLVAWAAVAGAAVMLAVTGFAWARHQATPSRA
jgi:hypothetical protein